MQSYLQFRRAGLAASAQVKRGHEKTGHDASGIATPGTPDRPLEAVSVKPQPYCRINPPNNTSNSQGSNPTNRNPSSPSSRKSGGISSDDDIEAAPGADTTGDMGRCPSEATALGRVLTGVLVRDRHASEGAGHQVFLVGWDGLDDRLNPRNWSVAKRAIITMQISLIGCVVGVASAIDATVLPQAAEDLGVSEVAESMSTGA